MATILFKRSSAGAAPQAANLTEGELALETSAGVLYAKNHGGMVVELARANPMSALGDMVYGGASGVPTKLAGDTSNVRKFMREQSVAGVATAPVWDTVAKTDVGLGNCDNTSDANKPVSTAQQTALDLKANLAGAAFTGSVSSTGSLSGAATGNAPPQLYGYYSDFTGYGGLGTSLLIPTAFDKMLYLTSQGGSITSDVTPSSGSLTNMVDGTGVNCYWLQASLPVNITFTLPTAWSYMRQFLIYFYPSYAPSQFTVTFYDASNNVLGSDTQSNWSASSALYCFPTGGAFYGTKKIILTITATTKSWAHIFEVGWIDYGLDPYPAYLKRTGGSMYGAVDMGSNKITSLTNGSAASDAAAFGQIPTAYSSTPAMDGAGSAGSSGSFSKGDHSHPSDTTRVPTTRTVNGKALSSDITITASDVGASATYAPPVSDPGTTDYPDSGANAGAYRYDAGSLLSLAGGFM